MEERRQVGQRAIAVRFEPNRHADEYLAEAYQNLINPENNDSLPLKSVLHVPSEPVHSHLSLEIQP